MKTILKLERMLALVCVFATLTLMSCNDEDTPQDVIEAVPEDCINQEFFTFMQDELASPYNDFFYEITPDGFYRRATEDWCHIINSYKALCSIYKGNKSIPKIDFGKYTLILGQVEVTSSGWSLMETKLQPSKGGYTLKVYLKDPKFGFCEMTSVSYWRLYPKLKKKKLTVEPIIQ